MGSSCNSCSHDQEEVKFAPNQSKNLGSKIGPKEEVKIAPNQPKNLGSEIGPKEEVKIFAPNQPKNLGSEIGPKEEVKIAPNQSKNLGSEIGPTRSGPTTLQKSSHRDQKKRKVTRWVVIDYLLKGLSQKRLYQALDGLLLSKHWLKEKQNEIESDEEPPKIGAKYKHYNYALSPIADYLYSGKSQNVENSQQPHGKGIKLLSNESMEIGYWHSGELATRELCEIHFPEHRLGTYVRLQFEELRPIKDEVIRLVVIEGSQTKYVRPFMISGQLVNENTEVNVNAQPQPTQQDHELSSDESAAFPLGIATAGSSLIHILGQVAPTDEQKEIAKRWCEKSLQICTRYEYNNDLLEECEKTFEDGSIQKFILLVRKLN